MGLKYVGYIGDIMFQSLFWWNVLLNIFPIVRDIAVQAVSILVLVECTSECYAALLINDADKSFNPCSGGMYF